MKPENLGDISSVRSEQKLNMPDVSGKKLTNPHFQVMIEIFCPDSSLQKQKKKPKTKNGVLLSYVVWN